MVCAVSEGDFPSRDELAAIHRGIDDVRNGKTFRIANNDSLDDFLNRIDGDGKVCDSILQSSGKTCPVNENILSAALQDAGEAA